MELKDIFKEHAGAVETRLKELGADIDGIQASLLEVQQKQVRRYDGGSSAPESWGKQFVNSDGLKSFADQHHRPARFRMDVKSTITSDAGSAGSFVTPLRDAPVAMPMRAGRVRDLLPTVAITSGSVEYPKQTTRTNNAANVAEAAAKPESAYAFSMETVTAKVIAHWVPASRQILEDNEQLAGVIDTELRYGLQLREDAQLLYGDGTGENIDGLVANATTYAAPFDPAGTETMLDIAALAALQGALADFAPNGIIVHPSDWVRMRLLKDADGKYLLGDPGAQVTPQLFGLPVIATTAMTVDKFLVGDFNAAATLYDRWAPRVEVSTEHADFFTKNLVAILAEQRIALGVKQGGALIYGDFGNVA